MMMLFDVGWLLMVMLCCVHDVFWLCFRDIVDEAKDYYLLPDRRYLIQSFNTSPRLYSSIIGLIFAVS
jgi:hypothetical protein